MTQTDIAALILDQGTYSFKAGLSGDDEPQAVFRTIEAGDQGGSFLYGRDALKRKNTPQKLTFPIKCGIITDWDTMERLWRHVFEQQLAISPDECPVLLTEAPFNPKNHREKMTEIMFETFNTPAMHAATKTVLSLYSTGEMTGVVLDVGESISHAVPIYEGYALPHVIKKFTVGGQDVSEELMKFLTSLGHGESLAGMDLDQRDRATEGMKEQLCYITEDYNNELKKSKNDFEQYKLPDGRTIKLACERFQCTEILFEGGKERTSVQDLVVNSIKSSDPNIIGTLYSKIVLAGGTSMLPGFKERIHKEIVKLIPSSHRKKHPPNVTSQPERKYASWVGGSVLANLSSFQDMWIAKEEFQEVGPSIIHQKCFY